jgi:hypothetical protein
MVGVIQGIHMTLGVLMRREIHVLVLSQVPSRDAAIEKSNFLFLFN